VTATIGDLNRFAVAFYFPPLSPASIVIHDGI
jgi:hypothetical protein